jgi:hypothetical protein
MNGGLLSAWLAEVVLITYRAIKQPAATGSTGTQSVPSLPLPSYYAATFVVYGALAFLPESAGNFGALVGWGFVVATALNLYEPVKAGTTPKVATTGETTAAGNTAAR